MKTTALPAGGLAALLELDAALSHDMGDRRLCTLCESDHGTALSSSGPFHSDGCPLERIRAELRRLHAELRAPGYAPNLSREDGERITTARGLTRDATVPGVLAVGVFAYLDHHDRKLEVVAERVERLRLALERTERRLDDLRGSR